VQEAMIVELAGADLIRSEIAAPLGIPACSSGESTNHRFLPDFIPLRSGGKRLELLAESGGKQTRCHLLKSSLLSLFAGLIRMPRRASASRRSISISALTLRKSATAHRFTASRMAFSARSGKAMRSGPGGRPR
jgi:hypothetical protein